MLRQWTSFICLLVLASTAQATEVTIDGEHLSGELVGDSGIAVFRGIPFAEPPVGDLRWTLPQPLVTTLPQRDATQFAPACMQTPRILEWYRGLAELFGSTRDEFEDLVVSEDCLYLNIWSPDLDDDASRPVMVYIHGGSNNSGWAYEPDYHGHVLAEHGVVVVSVAYRLGVFGFMSHPEIDTANFGLWDQVAALEWIQDNIAKFGGDPDRVTIFGESAGAQDVLALMASKKAKGLFHGAIMQSNAGFGLGQSSSPSLKLEQRRGMETAALFGFEGQGSLERLRTVPAEELLKVYEERPDYYYHSPAVDGQLITKPIWDIINSGELSDVPFIIGSNADERYNYNSDGATKAEVEKAVRSSNYLSSDEALEAVLVESDPLEALDRIGTADGMLCASQYLAAHQTAMNDNGWAYYFSRVREGEAGAKVRAYHGAELPYTFGTHPTWMSTTDVDRRLTDQILSYWTQFAASGNPNMPGLPDWPTFTGPDGTVMEFAAEAHVGAAQEADLCRIFRESVAALK